MSGLDLMQDAMTARQIADDLGISVHSVKARIKELGIRAVGTLEVQPGARANLYIPTPELLVPSHARRVQYAIEDATELADQGLPFHVVAARLNYRPESLERVLHRAKQGDLVARLRENSHRRGFSKRGLPLPQGPSVTRSSERASA